MSGKVCITCKEEKSIANYIATKSTILPGSLPICRLCLTKLLKEAPEDEKWNVMDKICQFADVPFIPSEWAKVYATNGKDAIGTYISIFRAREYSSLDWQMYNKVYLELKKEDRVEDAIPELKEKYWKTLRRKWGRHYEKEDLEYLENLHLGILQSQNVVGFLNEDQALKLCKISLIIEQKIRGGVDFSKDLKAYDELSKLANLTPKNAKDAGEFDSVGEIFAYLEKTGWTNQYYNDAARDEVDHTEKNIKNWLRYLYVNESGIGEEVNERINNLKIASELEEIEFDEKEFRNYMDKEDDDAFKEEFKIDI